MMVTMMISAVPQMPVPRTVLLNRWLSLLLLLLLQQMLQMQVQLLTVPFFSADAVLVVIYALFVSVVVTR